MQLILTTLSLSLSLLPFTIAAGTCSSSGSLSWPPVGDCSTPSKFDTAVQTCRACCMNDAPCFTACLKAAGLGDDSISTVEEKRDLDRRAVDLSCAVNEGCYKFTDGSLLCLNLGTGKYHDDVGGNGDYYDGTYTAPNGNVQTGTSSPTATGRAEASSIRGQTTRSAASVQATSTGGATITSAGSQSTNAAAASAIGGNYLGANVGLVGLVAGLFL